MREVGDLFVKYDEIALEQDRRTYRSVNGLDREPLTQMFTLSDAFVSNQNSDDLSKKHDRVGMHTVLAQAKGQKQHKYKDLGAGTFISEPHKADKAMESPIERILLPWLVNADYGPMFVPEVPVFAPTKGIERLPDGNIFIIVQMPIGSYRTDFMIVAKHKSQTKIVAVECDGEDYHGTRKDMLRDGFLACMGIQTVRASGAEIKNSADRVATKIANIIFEWAVQL